MARLFYIFLMFQKIFDWLLRFLIVFLPWSTLISVFLTYKIGIPKANFLKEIILVILFVSCCFLIIHKWKKTKKFPLRLGWIDGLIGVYITWMIAITLPTTGISGLIYGIKYDLLFLIIFLCFYHGQQFLMRPISHYLKLFLISGGLMLFFSGLIKWPLSEDILLFFGYSGNPSAWEFGSAPPIFHGVDGANVQRFQGILDGPNSMGAFIIFFFWALLFYTRRLKDWYFVIGLISIVLILMVMYTYSRSAWIGFAGAALVMLLSRMGKIYKKHKKQFFALSLITAIFCGFMYRYYTLDKTAILSRKDSNKGHYERLVNGIGRVKSNPVGQGMGSAGPAYRHVQDLRGLSHKQLEVKDFFYIPESWFVQVFIEGGVFGGVLFFAIIVFLGLALLFFHPFLGASFGGIAAMNLVLHTYESSVVSYTLFIFVGLILGYAKYKCKKSQ